MGTTLDDLHRIAAHVLGRRHFEVSGHFGLRASPGGLATPAFGPEPEVVRLAGASLVHEVGAVATLVRIDGSTLAELAEFVGADLATDYSAGPSTPGLGAASQPLRVSADRARCHLRVVRSRLAGAGRDAVRGFRFAQPVDRPALARAFRRGDGRRARVGVEGRSGLLPGGRVLGRSVRVRGAVGKRTPGRCCLLERTLRALVSRAQAADAASCLTFLQRGLDRLATR